MLSSLDAAHPNTSVSCARHHLVPKEEDSRNGATETKTGKGYHRRWFSESSVPITPTEIMSMGSPSIHSPGRNCAVFSKLAETREKATVSSSLSPNTGRVVASLETSSPQILWARRKNQVANNAVRAVNLATVSPGSTTAMATPPDSPAVNNDNGLVTKKLALLRCQVACREGDYHAALTEADELLSSMSRRRMVDKKKAPKIPLLPLDTKEDTPTNGAERVSDASHFLELATIEERADGEANQEQTESAIVETKIRAEVLGCKRFALMKLSRFQEASSVLEESATLRKKHVRNNSSDSFFGGGIFGALG